jgi:hypothetical protein
MREKKVEVRVNEIEYNWVRNYAEKEQISMGEAMRRFLNSYRLTQKINC